MNINQLRKIYPQINKDSKNIKWRRLTNAELDKTMQQLQVVSNCYDEATRYALLSTTKGREMLKNRFWIEKGEESRPAYKFKLNINGKDEIYRSTYNDYWGAYSGLTDKYYKHDWNSYARLSLGINIAVDKMISKHPKMKPLISKLLFLNHGCEYNQPSNAFRWFTGKEPVAIGETELNLSLKPYKKEVSELFDRLKQKEPNEYSFVAMTGPFPASIKKEGDSLSKHKISSWHCCSILHISKNKEVTLHNPRTAEIIHVPFDEFIKKFKGVIGLEH